MNLPYDISEVSRLTAARNGAAKLFDYLRQGLARDAGCGLLTALVYDMKAMRSCRVYSEDLDAYPVGNFKALVPGPYYDRVVAGKAAHAACDIDSLRALFFDWEKIRDLGFESSLNIPAVINEELVGTVNLLGPSGAYGPANVKRALAWRPVIDLCFLLLMQRGPGVTFHEGLAQLPAGIVEKAVTTTDGPPGVAANAAS